MHIKIIENTILKLCFFRFHRFNKRFVYFFNKNKFQRDSSTKFSFIMCVVQFFFSISKIILFQFATIIHFNINYKFSLTTISNFHFINQYYLLKYNYQNERNSRCFREFVQHYFISCHIQSIFYRIVQQNKKTRSQQRYYNHRFFKNYEFYK